MIMYSDSIWFLSSVSKGIWPSLYIRTRIPRFKKVKKSPVLADFEERVAWGVWEKQAEMRKWTRGNVKDLEEVRLA